eukprot:2972383-Pyramimonas_sp.AAC.1
MPILVSGELSGSGCAHSTAMPGGCWLRVVAVLVPFSPEWRATTRGEIREALACVSHASPHVVLAVLWQRRSLSSRRESDCQPMGRWLVVLSSELA